MANPIVYSNSSDGQTKHVVSALGGQNVEVTSATQSPPTVTLDATLLVGSLNITADHGATAKVDVVASAAGTLSLNADGGVIEASSAVSALTGVSVSIANGGTFKADSSFLSLLGNATISFASDRGAVDTLQLDNGGGLVNLPATSPLVGFQTGGTDVIDNSLIDGASVASYAITQASATQPDFVTYYDADGRSLGSLSFAAGTFNPGQLGSYVASYVGGPLQLSVASDGDVVTSTNGNVLDGGGLSVAVSAGNWVTLDNTGGTRDRVSGSEGKIYVTNAQGSIIGGGNTVYFDKSASDVVNLSQTNGVWDTVYASGGEVFLNEAQSTVIGGGVRIYATTGSSVSLLSTNNHFDGFHGSNDTITLNAAQASIFGGGNTIYGYNESSVSLFNTNGNWDTFRGSNDRLTLNNAQASIFGGGDKIHATAGSSASLYNTGDDWDLFNGSKATVELTNAKSFIFGGGNTVYADANSAVGLYDTNGEADEIHASGDVIKMTNSQASIVGNSDTVFMFGENLVSLSGDDFVLSALRSTGEAVVNGFNSTDGLFLSSENWTSFAALKSSGDLFQSGSDTVIKLDVSDSVTLTGVQASSLKASEFKFVDQR